MELSFADLEEGTSALSTPSSLNMSRLKNLQETSAGLNQFSFFESNVDDSSERHFKRKAGTVETGANLKPTDILALKKKQLGPAGCGADDGDGRSTGLKGILKTPKSGCNVTMDETGVNAGMYVFFLVSEENMYDSRDLAKASKRGGPLCLRQSLFDVVKNVLTTNML